MSFSIHSDLNLTITLYLTNYFLSMILNLNQQLLDFFGNVRSHKIEKFITIPLSKCPFLQEESANYPEHIYHIFTIIFNNQQPKELNMRTILPFKQRKTPMPVCNRLFVRNDLGYQCYDCMIHKDTVLCVQCFEKGNHQGHRFSKIQLGNGNCDCGNPDAILQSGFCIDHNGKADEMIIDKQEEAFFNLVITQVFIWVMKLVEKGIKRQAVVLLSHLIDTLDWLNNESLYYNTLTNKILFTVQNQMIGHILILGSEGKDNPLARKATELFLKMFSLEIFKENIAIAYLLAYNNIPKFQISHFQSLYIQLFSNNDLVERVIEKSKIFLDPRGRQYDPRSYYKNLLFMDTIKQRAARAFFTPIIQAGGVHCKFIDEIEKYCEKGVQNLQEIYSENIQVENEYYNVSKSIIKLIKNTPQLMQMELRNHYKQITQLSFTKNKIIIPHHRVFVMLVFVYFKCDFQNVDMNKLSQILEIKGYHLKNFLNKLAKCFLFCLKECGREIGSDGYGRYSFEDYINLYCRSANQNRIILLDMMGIKFCAIAFDRIKQSWSKVTSDIIEQSRKESMIALEDYDPQEQEQEYEQQEASEKPKSSRSAAVFFLGWLNTISLIIQTLIYDRSEVCLTTELEIDSPQIAEMYDNQFKKLALNVKEQSMHEMQAMGIFWFSNHIEKAVINKYTTFDKAKKKFVIKEGVTGISIKRQLLKSFAKTPDHYLKASDQIDIEITDKIRRWRRLLFPTLFIQRLYQTLVSHLSSALKQQFEKYLKQIANNLKLLNMVFEYDNEQIEDMITVVTELSEKTQKLKEEIASIFQVGKKESIEEEADKDKNQKRRCLLKKKKQEKLKIFKSKQNINKFLSQNQPEIEDQKNQDENCIICYQQSKERPLYYMASTFSSNIAYAILKIEGINPFFLSCFHSVHQDCFLSISKQKQKIYCPLCQAMTNIIIPTESSLEDQEVIKISIERIQIFFALEYKKQYKNLYIEILRSFIQLFFSAVIEEELITQRHIKLFRILFRICQKYFQKLQQQAKQNFLNDLKQINSKYQKSSKVKYNFGLLIDIFLIPAIKRLKSEDITYEVLKYVCSHCQELPRSDFVKGIKLASKIFNFELQIEDLLEEYLEDENKIEFKELFIPFDPPKSIKALLQSRRQIEKENICKLGHSICICLICSWKGCFDCKACLKHTNQFHSQDSFYFHFITGGFFHQYNGIQIRIRSLYVNDLGESWRPKFEDDGFYFENDIYKKMIQALKSGNLIHFIRSNYEYLKPPKNSW